MGDGGDMGSPPCSGSGTDERGYFIVKGLDGRIGRVLRSAAVSFIY